jgi:hypothetical protein
VNEAWDHLSEANRRVLSLVDVPELVTTSNVTVTAGNDYADKPATCYHLLSVFNLADSFAMHPEPGGMLGRARYLTTTGKPPSGSATHFFEDGTRIYVRDTPSVNTSLQLRFRTAPAAITDADVDSSPLTPDRYDWAFVHAALRNFYQTHPSLDLVDGDSHIKLSDKAERALQAVLGEPRPDYAEVNKGVYHVMRLSGYNMSPRRR